MIIVRVGESYLSIGGGSEEMTDFRDVSLQKRDRLGAVLRDGATCLEDDVENILGGYILVA